MLYAALIALSLQSAAAQPSQPAPALMGPVVPRPRATRRQCEEPDPNADQSEIVVCGERSDDSPYRIPRGLRDQGLIEDRDMSWDARTRDMEAVERFSSQTVGPAGMSQRSRQVDCEWRAARQIAQGRQPDCGRRDRPDDDRDWERSQRR